MHGSISLRSEESWFSLLVRGNKDAFGAQWISTHVGTIVRCQMFYEADKSISTIARFFIFYLIVACGRLFPGLKVTIRTILWIC